MSTHADHKRVYPVLDVESAEGAYMITIGYFPEYVWCDTPNEAIAWLEEVIRCAQNGIEMAKEL